MAFKELLPTIRSMAIFHGLSDDKLEMILGCSRVRSYKAGDIIAREADKAEALHLVVTGQVKLFKLSAEGKEQTLYVFGPGESFCLCSAFCDGYFPANAAALKQSLILMLPAGDMEKLSRQEPDFLFNILKILSSRLKESIQMVESLSLKEVPQRLAAFFLHSAGNCPSCDDASLKLHITQRELAKIIGATPESISRALRRLSDESLIEIEGRSIRLLDRQALQNLAEKE